MRDSDPAATFTYAARKLGEMGIVYLHVMEPVTDDHMLAVPGGAPVAPKMREAFGGVFMLNGGYGKATGDAAIASGAADLISFGTPSSPTPTWSGATRGAPLNAPDMSTMYGGGGAEGYTDYPALA